MIDIESRLENNLLIQQSKAYFKDILIYLNENNTFEGTLVLFIEHFYSFNGKSQYI